MANWILETGTVTSTAIHICPDALPQDDERILRKEIGGVIRCTRCGDRYIPPSSSVAHSLMLQLCPVPSMKLAV